MRVKLLLLGIVVLAFILRVINLSSFPAGFNADETAHGYTAYSILKTGKDEWGVRLPINPRSVGDFKLPLYAYLSTVSIAVFGLNEFAVRFPSVVFGSLSVLAVFFLIKELFKDSKLLPSKIKIDANLIALISAFFLAVSPWSICLSRIAHEASLNLFLLPLGIWLFLKAIENERYFFPAAIIFGINLFSYHAARFFTPIAVILLIGFFWKKLLKKKGMVFFLLVFGFFSLMAFGTLFMGGSARVADTSIFRLSYSQGAIADRQYEAFKRGFPFVLERVFNNKVFFVVNKFFRTYLQYFSFDFLFIEGVLESTYGMIPGRGVLYPFELILLGLAFWQIIKNKDRRWLLILILLLLSPIPAALSVGGRAGGRSSTALPFWQIISAYGAIELIRLTKEKLPKYYHFLLIIYSFIFLVFFSFFLEDYFLHAPTTNAPFMAYPWKQIGGYLASHESEYDKIIISKRFSEPQIMIAFHLKIDPIFFQKESPQWLDYQNKGFVFVDQLPEYHLGKYFFKNFNFPEDERLPRTLFIGKEEDFAGFKGTVKEIVYYPEPWKKIAAEIVTFSETKN